MAKDNTPIHQADPALHTAGEPGTVRAFKCGEGCLVNLVSSVLPAGMRVAHRNKGKERYGHRHSQDNRIYNPISHALAAFSESMRGYPVGTGPGWLATNQRAIIPIANTTTINTPVRVHMRASLPFTREGRR